jgi:hypothetical protein
MLAGAKGQDDPEKLRARIDHLERELEQTSRAGRDDT